MEEMDLILYNTLSRRKEKFLPGNKGVVKMYLCGPTVYDYLTIGNYRTYIFGDILRRILKYNDYKVDYVQNITDVGHLVSDNDTGEDKLEKGAKREGKTAKEVADFFFDRYKKEIKKLNIEAPNLWCRAADPENIKLQIEMIKKLEAKGYTYKISDGVYFDTSKSKNYGEPAELDIEGLRAGARVDVNPEKKNITDFALWKFSPMNEKRQMEWESPWGKGFPGWHIECSAMSIKYLTENNPPFDIHAGGVDLIPVHHTNEIAQNEAVYDKKTVNYWLHGGFLQVNGGKMGKSLGNAYTISDLEERGFNPLAFRYLTFNTHYRQPMNFTWEAVVAAKISYSKLIEKVKDNLIEGGRINASWNEKFIDAINDDLNMPRAMAIVWEMLRSELSPSDKVATVEKFDDVLGLSLLEKATDTATMPIENGSVVEKIKKSRDIARANKDWPTSDKLRKDLEELGYKVEDSDTGSEIYKI